VRVHNRESDATAMARAQLNEWLGLVKDAARIAFRGRADWPLARHDLRIGVPYQTRRVASVLAEARAIQPGLKKHKKVLASRLTVEELDQGNALIEALAKQCYGRVGALNEQLEKKFERGKQIKEGHELARQVMDAAELAFRSADDEPLRDLFFGLDERMAGVALEASNRKPGPAPVDGMTSTADDDG
jgi:hypothetical protein